MITLGFGVSASLVVTLGLSSGTPIAPPVYGDPQFTRVVLDRAGRPGSSPAFDVAQRIGAAAVSRSRRIGATPDTDGAERIGDDVEPPPRRIGRTIQ